MLKQSFFVVATFAATFAVATSARADSCADAIKAYNNRGFDRKIPQYVLNEFMTRGREREERECQLSSAMAKEGRRQIELAKAAERACGRALELHSPDGKDDGCRSIVCLEKMQKETEGRRDKACNEAVRLGTPVERAKEACANAYGEDAVAACAKVADMPEASAADKEAALMRSAEERKHPTEDDKVIEDLTRAIALVPDDPKPLLQRALFWPLDKKDRAIEDASKAIEMNPADAQGWSIRGGAYLFKDDYAHATSDLRAATKLDPKNESIWQELAHAYEMAKDYSNALKAAAELKRLNPTIGDITENMIKSDVEFDRKMAEEAKKPKRLATEVPKVEAPKRPSIDWHDARAVDADDACNSFLAFSVESSGGPVDRQIAAHLGNWKSRCERHPIKEQCQSINEAATSMGKKADLHCNPTSIAAAPLLPAPTGIGGFMSDPIEDDASRACAYYSEAITMKVERDYAEAIPDWKSRCEQHPKRDVCFKARDEIKSARGSTSLNCSGGTLGTAGSRSTASPPATAAPVALEVARPSFWEYKGSTLSLVADGNKRKFYYLEPHPIFRDMGVTRGTLFFEGTRAGSSYKGVAYVFSRNCKPIAYAVSGDVSNNDRKVTLVGKVPVRDNHCHVIQSMDRTMEVVFHDRTDNWGGSLH